MTHDPQKNRRSRGRVTRRILALLTVLALASGTFIPAALAASYTRIGGSGSSWAGNAVNQWVTDIRSQGSTVDYNPSGSSTGRKEFANGLVDFAVSEIPYKGDTADPQDTVFPGFKYSMLPIAAGGTSFMYNLPVNGKRFSELKLTQDALARIFTGKVTRWNDPAIAKTNPGVNLPNQQIRVVVRSEGSGATAQFTLWMKRQFPSYYAELCGKTGGCPNGGATSYFPGQGIANFSAQNGSSGVTTYTANTPYTINYDEYSYALGANFPVAQVGNAAGFFTIPTDTAVAVALTKAKINMDASSPNYLSQDLSAVYTHKDPRVYALSAYTYMLVPAQTRGSFDNSKGAALGNFASYSLCEGQQTMGALGYSPLPMNLVMSAMQQVKKIPGLDSDTGKRLDSTINAAQSSSGNPCNNPTFKPGQDVNNNQLVYTAPFPSGCDAACQAPWRGKNVGYNAGPGAKPGQVAGGSDGPAAAQGPATAQGPGANGAVPQGNSPAATTKRPTAANKPSVSCNRATGQCTDAKGNVLAAEQAQQYLNDAPEASGPGAKAVPLVLAGNTGWGTSQNLLVVAALFLLLLVLTPPLAARYIRSGRRGKGTDS
ncbi:phosphate ABC transporter substrate-binding protein PstS [Arthrobacter sp.]|uniref:phosphate ABC transporter substrate-binding protein PstS n=1 Tax=Arthrobacter sp. TaxID=1667 RepID=UPI002590C195|nr:phosphate ABC transporter substrate-binding protein PstS [Arthrobacter sp.]